MYPKRLLYEKVRDFVLKSNKQACGLLGSYGVGKTTLIKQLYHDLKDSAYTIYYYDALDYVGEEKPLELFSEVCHIQKTDKPNLVILDNFGAMYFFDQSLGYFSDIYDEENPFISKTKLLIISNFERVHRRDLHEYFCYERCECEIFYMRDLHFVEWIARERNLSTPEDVNDLKVLCTLGLADINSYFEYMALLLRLDALDYLELWLREYYILERNKCDQRGIDFISFYKPNSMLDLLYAIATEDHSSEQYKRICSLEFSKFKELLKLLVLTRFIGFESKGIQVAQGELYSFLFTNSKMMYPNLITIDTVKKVFENFRIFFSSLRSFIFTARILERRIGVRCSLKLEDFLKGTYLGLSGILFQENFIFKEESVFIPNTKEELSYVEFLCKTELIIYN